MSNQNSKKENLEPQDSEEKDIKYPQDDNEAVVKDKDKKYTRESANLKDPAKQRETSEQPVHPVKKAPKKEEGR